MTTNLASLMANAPLHTVLVVDDEDIVLVAFGAPKQEVWIDLVRDQLARNNPVLLMLGMPHRLLGVRALVPASAGERRAADRSADHHLGAYGDTVGGQGA